jgi:hypothetical protein
MPPSAASAAGGGGGASALGHLTGVAPSGRRWPSALPSRRSPAILTDGKFLSDRESDDGGDGGEVGGSDRLASWCASHAVRTSVPAARGQRSALDDGDDEEASDGGGDSEGEGEGGGSECDGGGDSECDGGGDSDGDGGGDSDGDGGGDGDGEQVPPSGAPPRHARSQSSSAVLSSASSRLKKGWRAVKKSSLQSTASAVKTTASASRRVSSLSSAYWKSSASSSSSVASSAARAGLPMTPDERAVWEEGQSALCDEWLGSILPAWKKKRSTARVRSLAFRGIPPGVRGRVWKVALGNPLNITRDLFLVLKDRAYDGRMEFLRSRDTLDKADGDVGGHGGRAEPMLKEERSSHKAIMLDLPRTFPELAFFHADGSQYEDALREVLEAFMYLRPDIGYGQGMSFLAAVLLLYMDDAADAFTCFANMLLHKSCFLHFFSMKMPEVRIYLSMHDRFVREEAPTLHAHFKAHGVDPDLYMINWVMSLYCGALPLDLVSRIWDIYVLDGDVAIFRAALGILKLLAPRLLTMSFEDMAYLLSHIPPDLEADALLAAVRGVRTVTRQRFKDAFRACSARHAAGAAAARRGRQQEAVAAPL